MAVGSGGALDGPGVRVTAHPVERQILGLDEAGLEVAPDAGFVEVLADEDQLHFPVSEQGIPACFDFLLVLQEDHGVRALTKGHAGPPDAGTVGADRASSLPPDEGLVGP